MTPEALTAVLAALGALTVREVGGYLWRRSAAAADATPLMQQQLAALLQRLDGVATRLEAMADRVTGHGYALEALRERVERMEARTDRLEEARRAG